MLFCDRSYATLMNPSKKATCRQTIAVGAAALTVISVLLSDTHSAQATAQLSAVSSQPNALSTALLAQSAGRFPTLTAESTGEAVVELQGMLQLLGFYQGAIDGIYSPATQTAVSQFQSAAGIVADGITGPGTWQKLLPQPADVQTVAAQPAPSTATPAPAVPPEPKPEPTPVPSGPPILRPGAEGPAVAQLQRELQALGYYDGSIDGGYGEQTQAAVEAFQSDQQLTVDAIVGPSTWDALSRALDS